MSLLGTYDYYCPRTQDAEGRGSRVSQEMWASVIALAAAVISLVGSVIALVKVRSVSARIEVARKAETSGGDINTNVGGRWPQ